MTSSPIQLQSIVDYSEFFPSIHPTVGFAAGAFYLSSTTFRLDSVFALVVDFTAGKVELDDKSNEGRYARAVRAGSD